MTISDTRSQAAADVDLVLRTRSGDAEAFGELWRRHHASGLAVARSVTSSIDPDALVREAYTRIHQAILKGGGPNGSFRAYLFTSIRNTAAASAAGVHDPAVEEIETGSADEAHDRGLIAQAFRSLPPRWQEVLWYSEVERMKASEIAPLLGMSAAGVSEFSVRARDGLRETWFHAHLRSAGQDTDCRWTIENLGPHARGNLSARAQQRIDDHLESCPRCTLVATGAQDIADHLPDVLIPLVLGIGGGRAYLASMHADSDRADLPSAPAPMPLSVVGGAAAAPDEAAVRSRATPTAAPVGSTRSVLGIGAVISAGTVVLLMAGVVAAAAVVPTLIAGAPSTSQPNAADPTSSSIASAVEPDESMNAGQPMAIPVDDGRTRPAPRTPPAPAPHAPKGPRAVVPQPVPATEPIKPTPAPAPSASPQPQPQPESDATPTPEPSPEPTPTPEPSPDPTPAPDPAPAPGDGSAAGDGSAPGGGTRPGGGTAPDDETIHGDDPILPHEEIAPTDENPFPETAE